MDLPSTPNEITGLGAIVHRAGVSFRVWAPNATSVAVVGTFNNWDGSRHVCRKEENGNWSINISEAKVGDEYRYSIQNGGQSYSRIDPRAREVTTSVGNGVVTTRDFDWQQDQFLTPSWNEMVIYEMHIGTFHSKDNRPGTFDSAIEKLPYLQSNGINVVELMPIAEFAGDYSWGYNPAHPFAIESIYGGATGLKKFIREAHKHGIGVILDVVYNHFGPSDLNLWQFDGWSENGKGGIYFYNDWRSATPWGDTRPDYGRGEVRQYIFDNAMMWLDEYHADGLRYDMTLYMRSVDGNENNFISDGFSLAQWVNREINQRFPGRITIAEDLRNSALLTLDAEFSGGQFSAQWDAGFVHPVRDTIIQIDDKNRSMPVVRDALLHKYNLDVFERVVYTESHDEVANGKQRIVSEIDPSENPGRYAIKRSTLGAALVMTAPGIPMLFQGQEFLRDKWFNDSRPIDWARAEEFRGIVRLYSDLIRLRRNMDGWSAGLQGQHCEVFHINDIDKVIAFRRWKEHGAGDDVVVIMNFAEGRRDEYIIGFPISGQWNLRLNSDRDIYDAKMDDTVVNNVVADGEPRDGYGQSGSVTIGAYSCLIYTRS